MKSQGDHVAAFAEAYCRHTKGRWAGQPVVFEPWQREFLDEAFRLDARGRRVYREVLLGVPRKNVVLASGQTQRIKRVSIDGLALDQALARLGLGPPEA